MAPVRFRFGSFVLDLRDRRLRRDDVPVELNARYLDALALLVRQQGELVSKDRFMAEVWKGVPVTDEALTQCIKTLRRQLGDQAGSPHFIETVPKYGYRFIAPVESLDEDGGSGVLAGAERWANQSWREFFLLGGAGTIGGGAAGIVGGLFYGLVCASPSSQPGASIGEASLLLVVMSITLFFALVGGAGVSFGIAAAALVGRDRGPWSIVGGAAGGMIVGSVVKLLATDAFNLLFGQTPGDVTGGPEGALLGGAIGLGVWLGHRWPVLSSSGLRVAAGALTGGGAGILIPLLGGHLMVGSLDLITHQFEGSRFRFDRIGALFGESGLGPVSQVVISGLEGALFGGCIGAAILLARQSLAEDGG